MPFFIETTDKPGIGAQRADLRPEHLTYLESQKSLLITVGAKLDDEGKPIGSVYVVDLDTREEAEAFIAADPFSKADLFAETRVIAFRKAFVDGVSYV